MAEDLPRFYLVTPPIGDAETFVSLLDEALAAEADIACLLIRSAHADDGTVKRDFKRLAALAQPRGIACLVPEAAHLAARIEADGVHLDTRAPGHATRRDDAIAAAKGKRIVGVGGLVTRDDAMGAGEQDIDYLMFGDDTAPGERTIEQVAWWAEIFNVPCVGFAGDLAHVPALASAGAEFVALGDAVWLDPRGPGAALIEAKLRLAGAPVAL